MIDAVPPEVRPRYERYQRIGYQPFDPVSKRTTAQMRDKSTESIIWAEKGAPQVVLLDSSNQNEISDRVNQDINELAGRGYRSLGVAQSDDGTRWDMVGLIPMFDPPRDDTKETIEKIKSLGISIKMITGDQVAIAKETSRLIGLGDNIKSAKATGEGGFTEQDTMKSDGYAQVFPEHKFAIVKALLDGHHTVGMTGDGVNDAPALKKASIGIAVEGATDAARSGSLLRTISKDLTQLKLIIHFLLFISCGYCVGFAWSLRHLRRNSWRS
jgi:H+-transporting ATPase